MINISTIKRFACLSITAAAFVLVCGTLAEISAQRDPFQKPGYMKPKPTVVAKPKPVKVALPPMNYAPPLIEARIEYFKRLRETAMTNGTALPKVTSVLTLNEMAVTGIFKTPRGYAAMVEATPIKLSYTIYPGEKFFDGQLVAVEENKLVFRKVSKVGEGKFVASVENKPLQSYSAKGPVESAPAPAPADKAVETASTGSPADKVVKPPTNPFLSPLDEMNRQPAEPAKVPAKDTKKPAKVAKNKGQ